MNAFAIAFANPALGVPPGEESSFLFFGLLFLGVFGALLGDCGRSSSFFGGFSGFSSAAGVASGGLRCRKAQSFPQVQEPLDQ